MLEVCLLGTGGMMPLPKRWLTSLMARCNGSSLLIDCGEGTQIAMREKGWSPYPIDTICFTHYHDWPQRTKEGGGRTKDDCAGTSLFSGIS